MAIEKMEKDSQAWEEGLRNCSNGYVVPGMLLANMRSLTVKIQSKPRSFDVNAVMKKPYATTTLSHMIELAAILGIYWKVFNRFYDEYQAEGNGYRLKASGVANFGAVFQFEKTGFSWFTDRRVIPVSEVKELCFGRVPTLFRQRVNLEEDVEWQIPRVTSWGDLKLEILQLSSAEEVMETLTQIGCNASTTLCFQEGKMPQHLFPVTFEIIGMLARTLHIRDRCFRFLPNPTKSSWNQDISSMHRLLQHFTGYLADNCDIMDRAVDEIDEQNPCISSVIDSIKNLLRVAKSLCSAFEGCPDRFRFEYRNLNDLHEATDITAFMLHSESSHSKSSHSELKYQQLVLDTLRCHLEEVVAVINNSSSNDGLVCFADLLVVPLLERERTLMQIYFQRILQHVVEPRTAGTDGDGNGDGASVLENPASQPHRSSEPREIRSAPEWERIVRTQEGMERLKIWYALVFRMICWLMLHDFDKKDIQMPDSDVMGSRQPVYII